MGQYKIIFSGETLPGHDPDVAREQLAQALKAGPSARERLFSGRPVSLKSGLDAEQAQRYRRRLAAMGVVVQVEAQEPAGPVPTTPPMPDPAPPPVAPSSRLSLEPAPDLGRTTEAAGPDSAMGQGDALSLVESVLADRMVCPKCGHEQPKRTLCQSCGVDMARVAAAQAETRGSEGQQGGARGPSSARDEAPALYQEEMAGKPKLIGFSFEGRMPRLTYFLGGIAVSLLAGVVVAMAAALGPILAGIAMLVMMVPAFRMSAMRFHDFNWSGWWSILLFVPFVGNLVALILLFMPGNDGSNDYGPQVESHGWKPVLIALAVFIAGLSFLVPMSITSYQAYAAKARAAEGKHYLANYDANVDEVFLFTSDDCGRCQLRRQQFDELGIVYTEMRLDEDPEMARMLDRRLAEGPYASIRSRLQLPFVEVNGNLVPNDPDLPEISIHFQGR